MNNTAKARRQEWREMSRLLVWVFGFFLYNCLQNSKSTFQDTKTKRNTILFKAWGVHTFIA